MIYHQNRSSFQLAPSLEDITSGSFNHTPEQYPCSIPSSRVLSGHGTHYLSNWPAWLPWRVSDRPWPTPPLYHRTTPSVFKLYILDILIVHGGGGQFYCVIWTVWLYSTMSSALTEEVSLMVAIMTWLTVLDICVTWPRICSTCHKPTRSFSYSWLIIGFVTRVTRRVQLER